VLSRASYGAVGGHPLTLSVANIDFLPRWLSLKEAARYGKFGEKRLVRMIQDHEIVGYKDPGNGRGDYVVDRKSIDRYRENQISIHARKKALEIVRSLSL